jgi:hypothetical protein
VDKAKAPQQVLPEGLFNYTLFEMLKQFSTTYQSLYLHKRFNFAHNLVIREAVSFNRTCRAGGHAGTTAPAQRIVDDGSVGQLHRI